MLSVYILAEIVCLGKSTVASPPTNSCTIGLGWGPNMRVVEDFYQQAVPLDERRSFTAVLFPLLGYVFIFAVVYAGGLLGSGLYLQDALIAGIAAALLLGTLAGLDGLVAADTGLSFGLLVRYSFGRAGAWFPNVIIPAILVTWFGISVSFVAQTFVQAYGGIYEVYVITVGTLLFLSAYYGIRMLVYLSYPTVIFCTLFGIVLIVSPVWQSDGVTSLFALPPVKPISMGDAITIAVGSFVTGATSASMNILRYGRTPAQGAAAGFISMGIGFFFILTIGIVGLKAAGTGDVIEIGRAVGMYHLGVWMLILLTLTTLDKSLYSSSLTFSASSGIPRSRMVIILGIFGVILGLFRSIDFIIPWLKTLGIIVPPLMGIIQADYWLARIRGERWARGEALRTIDYSAVTIWALSVAAAWWSGVQQFSLSPAIISIGLAVVARVVIQTLYAGEPQQIEN